jgi:hypothetical protein
MDIHELIEMFNEGDMDFIQYFSDIETFLKVVNKRGLLDELDPEGQLAEHFQNELLLFYHEHDKEKFWQYILKFLGDVELIDGIPHIILSDRGELSRLFCDGNRYDISQDTVESILTGEHDREFYYDSTDDVYRDVIQELTKENLKRLKEYIIQTLDGQQLPTNTEVLESIAQRENTEYVTVNESNIDEIVDDEETMNELMKDELNDLKSELYSVHSQAYNNAYEDELFEDIMGELSTYFGDGEWVTRPHTYKKDTEVQKYKAPIHNFESNITDYLRQNKGYSYGTLEYWGSYIEILKDQDECLSIRPPDYPDSRKVDKNINMYFNDYI